MNIEKYTVHRPLYWCWRFVGFRIPWYVEITAPYVALRLVLTLLQPSEMQQKARWTVDNFRFIDSFFTRNTKEKRSTPFPWQTIR